MRWLLLLLLAPGLARADERWDRYQVLMWQDRTPAQLAGLRAMGFTGTKLHATGGVVDAARQAVLQAAGMPWYLENLATDYYSPYHRYIEGRAVNALFEAARARHRAEPSDPAPFLREPGLSDPVWATRIADRLRQVARAEAPLHPLFYNLADESGIADLAAAWDSDRSPASLAAMRAWLRTQYADLAALNGQWGTGFATWDDVVPELTDAALARTDGNFSAWSDFKAWMDVAYARAVRAGAGAVHEGDPAGLAALEGGQIPGWGGYDYALLAPAVDVMEIYDDGNALDLATAFNPALIPLRTTFGTGSAEEHGVWRNLLHGGRGMVVWDEADDIVAADGTALPRGRELARLVGEVGAVSPELRRPAPDAGVAVLVSQESFRTRWLLDRRAGDHDWAARDAEREYDDNAWRASRRVLLGRLAELGVEPLLVSGVPPPGGGVRLLLLPHAIAVSDAELAGIAAFRAAGGTVLADTEAGLFDGHGRRRAVPPLRDVPHPQAIRVDGEESSAATLDALATLLSEAGVPPRATIQGADGQRATGLDVRWFQAEGGAVVSLQMARPAGAAAQVTLKLPGRAAITDVRRPERVMVGAGITVALDAVAPTLLRLAAP